MGEAEEFFLGLLSLRYVPYKTPGVDETIAQGVPEARGVHLHVHPLAEFGEEGGLCPVMPGLFHPP